MIRFLVAFFLTVGPVWDFKERINFNLGLNLGIGYSMDKHDNNFTPIANFIMGWVISRIVKFKHKNPL
jgi:hypothetical protein